MGLQISSQRMERRVFNDLTYFRSDFSFHSSASYTFVRSFIKLSLSSERRHPEIELKLCARANNNSNNNNSSSNNNACVKWCLVVIVTKCHLLYLRFAFHNYKNKTKINKIESIICSQPCMRLSYITNKMDLEF